MNWDRWAVLAAYFWLILAAAAFVLVAILVLWGMG